MGLVQNLEGLIACRVLLGLFEAGMIPGMYARDWLGQESMLISLHETGCIYLISMYYRRYEVQWRMSLFFSASILAGAFSGLLAYSIANLGGISELAAWRWYVPVLPLSGFRVNLTQGCRIFIIEGLLTVVVGITAKWWIPDWPKSAGFLNGEERSQLVARLADDTGHACMDHLNKAAWKRILSDWKIYIGTLAYFGVVNNGYTCSVGAEKC